MGFKSKTNPCNTLFKQNVVAALYHDIYIFPETHCIKDEIIHFDGYSIYHKNRVPHARAIKGSGGIAIAIHSSVISCHTILSVFYGVDGQIAVKMKCNKTDSTVGILGLYLSPDTYRYGQDSEEFFNHASALWQELWDCDLIVGGGDINARTKDLIDYIPEVDGQIIPKRQNPDNAKNAHATSFITFLKDNRSIILNGRVTPEFNNYTFVSTRGCSVPDYIFCPVDNLQNCVNVKTLLISDIINEFNLLPPKSIPDHSILSSKFVTSFYDIGKNYELFDLNINQTQPCPSSDRVKPPRKNLKKVDDCFMMSDETRELVLNTISKIEEKVDSKVEIDRLWMEVKQIILSEMKKLPDLPRSKFKKQNKKFKKSNPFWNEELQMLWSKSCAAEKNYLKFRVQSGRDFRHKNNLRLIFKEAQSLFDKKYRFYKRQHRKKEYCDLENHARSNPTEMWAALKRLNNPPDIKAALEIVREDGSITNEIKEVLERWFRDISRLYSGLREDPEVVFDEEFYREVLEKKREFEEMSPDEQTTPEEYDAEDLNDEISYDEVAAAIDKSKNRKAYLEIPNEVMKNKHAKILLHKFFNLCFVSGQNPSDWDFSDIIPIPKKDKDARDPLQNRCITIVCCVAKIYSSILNKRLQNYLETNNILAEEQNGFRGSRSCIDHIFIMCTILRNRKSLGKETFLCFIDYKKAFDSVDRNLLMFKLSNIGIVGNMYNAISSLYSNPKSRIILQDYNTEYFDCPAGVKQGDCLSPTLFSIFINNLAKEIKESNIGVTLDIEDIAGNIEEIVINILLYADDIVIFAENEEDLQSLLFIVQIWCEKWRLEVNLSKTNILHVRQSKKTRSRFLFLFNKQPVPYCSFYKYLGCNINEHLDFNFTMDMQADSAGRALSSVVTKMIKNKGFPFSIYSILYQACVCSVSQYGSEVFGFDKFDSTFKLHLRAARAFLGLPKNVTSYGLVSELDWLLPHFQTQIKMIQYFNRIMSTPSNRLLYKIFTWDRDFNLQENVPTWSSEVKSIFYEYNMGHIFDQQQIFSQKETIQNLKSLMFEKQKQLVQVECENKPKLRTFMQFKDFQTLPAPHVGKPLSFVERRTISKLRLGILPLRVETARYTRPIIPENERLCYCKSGDIESESHALFSCCVYNDLRQGWLNKICIPDNFLVLPGEEKLGLVLNHPENVKPTAQYLIQLMDLRNLKNKDY